MLTLLVTYDPDARTFSAPLTIAPFAGAVQRSAGTVQAEADLGGTFDAGFTFAPDASVAPYLVAKPSLFIGKIAR